MSLIYKSLQQLKKHTGDTGVSVSYSQLNSKQVWPWRTIVTAIGLSVLMLILFFLLQSQIEQARKKSLENSKKDAGQSGKQVRQKIVSPSLANSTQKAEASPTKRETKNRTQTTSSLPRKAKTDKVMQADSKQPEQEEKPPPPPSSAQKNIPQKASPAPRSKDSALAENFSNKVQKNQAILELENKLRSSLGKPRHFSSLLAKLQEKTGKNSSVVHKWQGFQALNQDNYALAEKRFQECLQENGPNLALKINVVLAQIGQQKLKPALKNVNELLLKHPENEKLTNLKEYLTER